MRVKLDSTKGEWKSGVKDGRGVFNLANKNIYEGEFKNDQIEGSGIYK